MGGISGVVEAAFSFPALIYTVSSILLIGFWVATTVIGAGLDGLDDVDFGPDTDVDVDLDLDVDGDVEVADHTAFRTAMEFLGLTGMPLLLGLNLVSIFAWAATMISVVILDGTGVLAGTIGSIISIVILIVAFLLGASLTRKIGRTLWAKIRPSAPTGRQDLVGKICTLTTQRVDDSFGQAEVRDRSGSSYVVQVRCLEPNSLSRGDSALIFNFDDDADAFTVSPDVELTSGFNP